MINSEISYNSFFITDRFLCHVNLVTCSSDFQKYGSTLNKQHRMPALPTLIHQTAGLLGLIRGLTEQRDVYKRLSCKTCDPFTLPSTFTSIFTLIWDIRRLYHTVFSCLEKCELWVYLYSLFAAFIKGGSEKMPTMISNAAFALKLLWRPVSYIQLISPLQSSTLYACVLDFSSYRNFVFNTLVCYLMPENENHSIALVNLRTQSQIWISINIFMLKSIHSWTLFMLKYSSLRWYLCILVFFGPDFQLLLICHFII